MYGQTVWCCAYRLESATVVFHSIGLAPATGLILVVLDRSSKVGRNDIDTGVAVVAHVLVARSS